MLRMRILAIVLSMCLVVCPAAAQRAASGPAAGASTPAPGATIKGTVWDAQNEGVPDARVRLRNLTTGRIDAATRSNQTGQFTFADVEEDSYVVEVVNYTGSVIGIGPTFALGQGETVATFVRLASRPRLFAGFFANLAAAAVASAAALGVTAIAPTGQPVSGGR